MPNNGMNRALARSFPSIERRRGAAPPVLLFSALCSVSRARLPSPPARAVRCSAVSIVYHIKPFRTCDDKVGTHTFPYFILDIVIVPV